MSEPSLRPLPVAFNASLPPEPPCGWSERGLFPLVCWNSAFSRHFYTFYEPSVQSMDTQLNALPTLPVLARTVSGCLNSALLGLF